LRLHAVVEFGEIGHHVVIMQHDQQLTKRSAAPGTSAITIILAHDKALLIGDEALASLPQVRRYARCQAL